MKILLVKFFINRMFPSEIIKSVLPFIFVVIIIPVIPLSIYSWKRNGKPFFSSPVKESFLVIAPLVYLIGIFFSLFFKIYDYSHGDNPIDLGPGTTADFTYYALGLSIVTFIPLYLTIIFFYFLVFFILIRKNKRIWETTTIKKIGTTLICILIPMSPVIILDWILFFSIQPYLSPRRFAYKILIVLDVTTVIMKLILRNVIIVMKI